MEKGKWKIIRIKLKLKTSVKLSTSLWIFQLAVFHHVFSGNVVEKAVLNILQRPKNKISAGSSSEVE